jgi:hypothetical protein
MVCQIDFFAAAAAPSISPMGLEVKLPRTCKCGAPHATICSGKGPHCGELRCAKCGSHRGWVSRETFDFIAQVVDRFGPPTEPITVRGPRL